MASSTRIPIASTRPNIVSTLIEKPNAFITANAPKSEIGTTIDGTSV